MRWRRRWSEAGERPDDAVLTGRRRLVGLELMLAAALPLLAVLMERGIGA